MREVMLYASGLVGFLGMVGTAVATHDAWVDLKAVKRLGVPNGRRKLARSFVRGAAARLIVTTALVGTAFSAAAQATTLALALFLLAQIVVVVNAAIEWKVTRELLAENRPTNVRYSDDRRG